MEYVKFDNDDLHTRDEDYSAFVQWLSERTSVEVRQAKGSLEAQRVVLCRYYKLGYRVQLTSGELIDFLAVSDSSILDEADYNEEEADRLMAISDSLTDAEIEQTSLA